MSIRSLLVLFTFFFTMQSFSAWNLLQHSPHFSFYENKKTDQFFTIYHQINNNSVSLENLDQAFFEKSIRHQFSKIILSDIDSIEFSQVEKSVIKGIPHFLISGVLKQKNSKYYFYDQRTVTADRISQNLLWSAKKIENLQNLDLIKLSYQLSQGDKKRGKK